MPSDFKNIFIGANNSKRTNLNLIDNEKTLSILIYCHLSLAIALRNTRKLKTSCPSNLCQS